MINSKYFNKILAVLLVVALTITVLLRYFPDTLPITSANSVSYDYETKLFDKNSVMSINIVVDEDDWNTMLENATSKEYIQADIQINGETFYSVGIRPKGNTSLSTVASDDTTDRYSFKVEFDHYVDQTCYGLDKLALNNIIQDATYMKEYMAYDLLSYMGIPSSLYSFANVSVNGEVWGLYLALEVPEESFAARNFGTSYGDLYKPESTSVAGGGNNDNAEISDTDRENFKNNMGKGQMGMFGGQTNDKTAGTESSESTDGTSGATEATDATTGTVDGTMPQMPSRDGTTGPTDRTMPQVPGGDGTTGTGNETMAQMPSGDETTGTPDGTTDASSDKTTDDATESTTGTESGTTAQTPDGNGMNRNGMGGAMGGMMGSGSGTDLVYTGDDLDNYSAIWESSVFDTTDSDHERIVEALKNISEGNLDGYLNVDTMLKYIAVNSVLVNYDSYFGSLQHNYYLYEKDGELTMLPWDYNLAFAGFQSNDSTSAVNDPIDTPVSGTTLEDRPLIGQVLADDENLEQYHEYLSQIVEEYFNSGYWEETIDRVDALISEYVENDPSAFYTYDEYKTAVATLKEFGLLRAESITGQLDGSIPSTEEEQSSNQDALIDASSISISVMGTQGGGMGGNKNFGNMNANGQMGNNSNQNAAGINQNLDGTIPQGDFPDDAEDESSTDSTNKTTTNNATSDDVDETNTEQSDDASDATQQDQTQSQVGGQTQGQTHNQTEGQTQGQSQNQAEGQIKDQTQDSESGASDNTSQMTPPTVQQQGGQQQDGKQNWTMTPPGGAGAVDTSVDTTAILVNLSCVGIAVVALIFVKYYKRRRTYS